MSAQHVPFDGNAIVTQHFGVQDPRYTALGLAGHNGTDYALDLATPIYAVEDGEVWEVNYDPTGFGYHVKVRTEGGADWLYAHLLMWALPRPGQWVGNGQQIGFSGSTGMSTGPHLHLGWRPRWWDRAGGYGGYQDSWPMLNPLFASS